MTWPRAFRGPLLVCLLFTLLHIATPLEHSFRNKETKGVATIFLQNFGLDEGGLITLNVTKVNPSGAIVYLGIFTENELSTIENVYNRKKDANDLEQQTICVSPSVLRAQVVSGETASISTIVSETERYSLLALNCHSTETATIDGTVLFLNPGEQHLSREVVPLIPVYACLLIAHLLMAIPWASVVIKYWKDQVSKMHHVTSLSLFMKIIAIILELGYLGTIHNTGHALVGLQYTKDIAAVLSSTVFLSLLVLTSLGWNITRNGLSVREKQLFWCFFILYVLFGVLASVCQSPSFCAAYELSFNVVKFLITFGIIVAMNASIERLRTFPVEDLAMEDQLEIYLISKMFQSFRWAFLAYFVFPILLLFVEVAVVRWQERWMVILLEEIVVMAVLVMVAVTFRPGAHQDYRNFLRDLEMHELELVSDSEESDDAVTGPARRRQPHTIGDDETD